MAKLCNGYPFFLVQGISMSELLRAIVPAEMMIMDGFFQALDAGGV